MYNINTLIVVVCYSINPFIKKQAIQQLNMETGYLLVQLSTTAGNAIFLCLNKEKFNLHDINIKQINCALISSALTILSSYKMTELIKVKKDISNLTTKIQILTIIMSYIIDYKNLNKLACKQYIGIILMITGLLLNKT
ncbi:MAG: hypothetical protein CMI79_06730 [Candidatus Pelagibacter sp.]|nr:hypothetical protein [Candidatus Pelagibacter sp.]|tara:strand:+ start:73 stop:489 length:417 start_codon:yes stop_codon:yes gene_type:complete